MKVYIDIGTKNILFQYTLVVRLGIWIILAELMSGFHLMFYMCTVDKYFIAVRQFIYDNQMDNISASSFKYAFKNFGNDITAKKDYLLKINPTNLPTIFKTDLDKDSLLDIIRCFNLFEHESQIIEYLKNIIKIPRIKLVIQLISKKYKNIIFDVLDNLEKGDYGSEVIPIKDFFHNN